MIRPADRRPGDPTLGQLAPERRLRRLELTITRRLAGLLHGRYLGLLPGTGSEPAGSREYRPGEDEVRHMDWAVTARTTLPHVREQDADRELTTWLAIDTSPSMTFGTADLDKHELATAAVAAVGFLTTGTGNRLGAHLLHPTGIHRLPARTGRNHLLGLLHTLLTTPRTTTEPATPPSLADALTAVHSGTRHRGLVVIVSDFLDGLPDHIGSPDSRIGPVTGVPAWERPVRRLAVRHQVLAIEVIDPRELELPDVGLITLVDPETGHRREIPTADRRLRERYAEAAASQRELVSQALRRSGAAHLRLRTDRDWVADIVRHVQAQRRLAGAVRHGAMAGRGGRL